MWARRFVRVLKRAALLLPLAFLAGALLLLNSSSEPPPLRRMHHNLFVQQQTQSPLPVEINLISDVQKSQDYPNENEEAEEVGTSAEQRRPWFMRGGERRPQYSQQTAPLFPEDAPGSDRIIEQLMYTLPEDDETPIKKILVANGLGSWALPAGRGEFIKNKCPVDRCTLTGDFKQASTADAVLFKDHIQERSLTAKRPLKQVWILYYLECPYHTASMRSDVLDTVNWTATYRRDSDIVAPYERWVYHDPDNTENALARNYAANKTKKVAWFVSNCHARNKRLQYARQLSKYISVDIYGACGNLHCPRADPNCLDMLDRDYKFYLAFENSNCKDYITEKFFVNGLGRDVLPIVMGARPSEYAAASPHKSYIHVEEFAGPEELAAYLHQLDKNDQLYNAYFKWKGMGEFINTYFFCRVCATLHAADRQRRTHRYTDVQAWWRDETCTFGEWRQQEDSNQDRIQSEDRGGHDSPPLGPTIAT